MSYLSQYLTIFVALQILIPRSARAIDKFTPIHEGQLVEYVLFDKLEYDWTYFPVANEKWNFDGTLKLIIHGFNIFPLATRFGSLQKQMIPYLGQQYSDRNSSQNVVLADWSPLATGGLHDYSNIAANTPRVGHIITDVLLYWKEVGAIKDWNMVHLIGFSLGAHVAGVVGDQIWRRTGQVLGRITGLDPAGPDFDTLSGELPSNTDRILDKSDAHFVDIYHCNMGIPHEGPLNPLHGRLGSAMKAGHVDFYPNGGERQPYVCSPQDDISGCSHLQCVLIYAFGVQNSYSTPSCPCQSYEIFLTSVCGCFDSNYTNAIYMGEIANQYSTISSLRYFAHVNLPRNLGLDSKQGKMANLIIKNLRVLYSRRDFFDVVSEEGQTYEDEDDDTDEEEI